MKRLSIFTNSGEKKEVEVEEKDDENHSASVVDDGCNDDSKIDDDDSREPPAVQPIEEQSGVGWGRGFPATNNVTTTDQPKEEVISSSSGSTTMAEEEEEEEEESEDAEEERRRKIDAVKQGTASLYEAVEKAGVQYISPGAVELLIEEHQKQYDVETKMFLEEAVNALDEITSSRIKSAEGDEYAAARASFKNALRERAVDELEKSDEGGNKNKQKKDSAAASEQEEEESVGMVVVDDSEESSEEGADDEEEAIDEPLPPSIPETIPGAATTTSNVTLKYRTGWDQVYLHYAGDDGIWTELPGIEMQHMGDEANVFEISVDANNMTFVLNNGGDDWDTLGGGMTDYTISAPGVYTLSDGILERIDCADLD